MDSDRNEKGRAIRRAGFAEAGEKRWEELRAIDAGHADSILEYCFGMVWARPGLDLKVRELLVIAAAAQECPGEVELHVCGALNCGATRQEIVEAIVQCSPSIGFPKTNHAFQAGKRVSDQWERRPGRHAR